LSAEASSRRPKEPVSTRTFVIIWQLVVLPGKHTLTVVTGMLKNELP